MLRFTSNMPLRSIPTTCMNVNPTRGFNICGWEVCGVYVWSYCEPQGEEIGGEVDQVDSEEIALQHESPRRDNGEHVVPKG